MFEQVPNHHSSGHGCPFCGGVKQFNKGKYIDNKNGTYSIPLTQNEFALIDKYDYELVKNYAWQVKKSNHTFYARTDINGKIIYIHRLIMGLLNSDVFVDHKDRCGLNNVKSNLRECTILENSRNTTIQNRLSKYKGVCFSKCANKWVSYITINKKRIHLGTFEKEIEAAEAYNIKAKEFFGEFYNINKF